MSPACALTGSAAELGAEVLCAPAVAKAVRLVAALELALALSEVAADSLAEDSLAEDSLELALESADEVSLALEADAESEADEEALLLLLERAGLEVAVAAGMVAVLVAPWAWKPAEKL